MMITISSCVILYNFKDQPEGKEIELDFKRIEKYITNV